MLVTGVLTCKNLAISTLTAGCGVIYIESVFIKRHRNRYFICVLCIALKYLRRSYNLNLHSDNKIFGRIFDAHLVFKVFYKLIVVMIINFYWLAYYQSIIGVLRYGCCNLVNNSLRHREFIIRSVINNLWVSINAICIFIINVWSTHIKLVVQINFNGCCRHCGICKIRRNPQISVFIGVLRKFFKIITVERSVFGNLNAISYATGLLILYIKFFI